MTYSRQTIKLTSQTEHSGYYIHCPATRMRLSKEIQLCLRHTEDDACCQLCTLLSPVLGCQSLALKGFREGELRICAQLTSKHHEEQGTAKRFDWAIEVLASFWQRPQVRSSFGTSEKMGTPSLCKLIPKTMHYDRLYYHAYIYIYICMQVAPVRYYTIWLQYMWINILQSSTIFSARLLFAKGEGK